MAYFSSLLRALLLAGLPLGAALAQTTGGVGIGTTTPNAAAVLDITSTTQGVLLPRLTLAQRNALGTGSLAAPVAGLLIYQTDNTPGLYAYDGTGWVRLGGDNLGNHTATQALNLQGNALVGTGASISGVGVGIRADGGLNLSQNVPGQNMLLGYQAGSALSTSSNAGSFNTMLGVGSGRETSTGGSNVFVGYQSGTSNTTGGNNVFTGFNSGFNNTTGRSNVFTGYGSGYANTTGSYNAFTGSQSGFNNTTGGNNVFTGFNSGFNNTTGSDNAFNGYSSGFKNTTGSGNVFTGSQSGFNNTTGGSNVFTGYGSGYANTTGSYNVFSGFQSGNNNTTGSDNAFNGFSSGFKNTTGGSNVFTGSYSGYANTTGGNNVFSGFQSGNNNATGNNNTFSGYQSGAYNTTGSSLTALGYASGPAVDGLTNATALGAGATLRQSNTVILGNGAASVGIGTSTPAGGLHVTTGNNGPGTGAATAGAILGGLDGTPPYLELRGGSTGTTPYLDFAETSGVDYSTRLLSSGGVLTMRSTNASGNIFVVSGAVGATAFNTTSDARLKTAVRPLGGALAGVLALRGVRYRWNALGVRRGGQAGAEQVGLLAQELEKVYPELVSTGPDGYKAVNYAQLAPVLIEALKEQQAQIEALKQQAAAATQRATRAEASLGGFEQRLRALEAGGVQGPQASK
jgi:hypothetical protein